MGWCGSVRGFGGVGGGGEEEGEGGVRLDEGWEVWIMGGDEDIEGMLQDGEGLVEALNKKEDAGV